MLPVGTNPLKQGMNKSWECILKREEKVEGDKNKGTRERERGGEKVRDVYLSGMCVCMRGRERDREIR